MVPDYAEALDYARDAAGHREAVKQLLRNIRQSVELGCTRAALQQIGAAQEYLGRLSYPLEQMECALADAQRHALGEQLEASVRAVADTERPCAE